jgi:CRISPR/Cas system CSM-associated protein Csm4 (group 5 of RAMP superfamily)
MGSDSGERNDFDRVFHSDSLYSAVTQAMSRLGWLEEWLDATARSEAAPAVRFSSLFPFLGDVQFVSPPRTLWPPAPSPKVRWRDAKFVPLSVVTALVTDQPLDDSAWHLDGASECLLPKDGPYRTGPFRSALRTSAAVDRLRMDAVEVHSTACLEFVDGAGMWAVVGIGDESWADRVKAALRLVADSGLGGEKSLGWGRSADPEFVDGVLPDIVLASRQAEGEEPGWWLLSLFSPGREDAVDWQRGSYSIVTRGGRIDSPVRSGDLKKQLRMVEEGSVVAAPAPPRGAAPDVAPEGFPHPVFRWGVPLAIPVPLRRPERPLGAS